MIGIAAYSAVFSRNVAGLEEVPGILTGVSVEDEKTTGPCAAYAVRAFSGLNADPESLGLVCISGPSGSTVDAFDRAWQAANGGTLTGPGFGPHRSKRIHPFTLVKSLQNQVPAALSMKFGLKGPALNLLEADSSLAHVLPNIEIMLQRCRAVALAMAAAGDRAEERIKLKSLDPGIRGLEGAACFLLTRESTLGYLEASEPVECEKTTSIETGSCPPILEPAIGLLRCIANKDRGRLLHLRDRHGHRTQLRWKGC